MIKVNVWQLTKITGHEDWYVIQVNFVQDFGDVIDVVFRSVGTLTFDTTVFQRNRNVRVQNVFAFGVSGVGVSKTVK